MAVPKIAESYAGSVNRVTLGATSESGGTRTSTVVVGGAVNVVYGGSSDQVGEKPVIAMDVLDSPPDDWPDHLAKEYEAVLDSPGAWAKKCVDEFGADLICLKFDGIHPEKGDRGADHAVKVTKEVLEAVGEFAQKASHPVANTLTTPGYRRKMAGVFATRAFREALSQATSN